MATDKRDGAAPSLHQRVHAATGDRAAEAKALAKDAGPNVDEDDALTAVRVAHGDVESLDGSAKPPDGDTATPADAARVHEQRD